MSARGGECQRSEGSGGGGETRWAANTVCCVQVVHIRASMHGHLLLMVRVCGCLCAWVGANMLPPWACHRCITQPLSVSSHHVAPPTAALRIPSHFAHFSTCGRSRQLPALHGSEVRLTSSPRGDPQTPCMRHHRTGPTRSRDSRGNVGVALGVAPEPADARDADAPVHERAWVGGSSIKGRRVM